MKYGIRKRNYKKSYKAKTSAKYKRKIKKAINPYYGKKGVGMWKDPKKAIYNKTYNKFTVDSRDIFKTSKPKQKKSTQAPVTQKSDNKGPSSLPPAISCVLTYYLYASGHYIWGTLCLLIAIFCVVGFFTSFILRNKQNEEMISNDESDNIGEIPDIIYEEYSEEIEIVNEIEPNIIDDDSDSSSTDVVVVEPDEYNIDLTNK